MGLKYYNCILGQYLLNYFVHINMPHFLLYHGLGDYSFLIGWQVCVVSSLITSKLIC